MNVPNTPNYFLAWTYFSGIVGNIFFFNMPGVAISGGIVFGLLLIPHIFVLRFGPPSNI
jgi:putative membrane protein